MRAAFFAPSVVARMERSEIRGGASIDRQARMSRQVDPGLRCAPSGLRSLRAPSLAPLPIPVNRLYFACINRKIQASNPVYPRPWACSSCTRSPVPVSVYRGAGHGTGIGVRPCGETRKRERYRFGLKRGFVMAGHSRHEKGPPNGGPCGSALDAAEATSPSRCADCPTPCRGSPWWRAISGRPR
jgi:hypothetical protein